MRRWSVIKVDTFKLQILFIELIAAAIFADNLRRLLSADRISRTSERSTAHILANGQIQFDKKTGKSAPFGQKNYLKPYEALYLMQIVIMKFIY